MRPPSVLALLIGHWHPAWSVDVPALAVSALYARAARRLRGRWPVPCTVSFLSGVACVVVTLQSGLDQYDAQLLSVHMVQHLLLLEVAPLLLLGGRPALLALRALPRGQRARLADGLTRLRPLTTAPIALAAFSLVVVGTHLPSFYDATLRVPLVHELEHAAYLTAGLLLGWSLLGGEPVVSRRLGGLGRLVCVLVAMVPMALIGAYLDRHGALVYAAYAGPARALHVSALADQAQAGAIMWVAGGVVMVIVGVGAVLSALIAEERRQTRSDSHPAVSASPGIGAGGEL